MNNNIAELPLYYLWYLRANITRTLLGNSVPHMVAVRCDDRMGVAATFRECPYWPPYGVDLARMITRTDSAETALAAVPATALLIKCICYHPILILKYIVHQRSS